MCQPAAGNGSGEFTIKTTNWILLTSVLAGGLTWIIDAVLDYYFFYQDEFWDLFILDVPSHELYIRLVIAAILVGFGAVVSRVVSRLNRSRREAQQNLLHLETTLRSIGDGVIATDRSGGITFMNPEAQSLTGWSEDEATGRSLPDVFRIVDESTGDEVINPLDRVLRDGVPASQAGPTALVTRRGSRVSVDGRGAPIRDANQNVIGAILVFRDVTERRRSEMTVAHLNSVLRAIQKVNRLITREHDRDKLIQQVCDNLIETRGYGGAWIVTLDETGAYDNCVAAGPEGGFETVCEKLRSGWLPGCCRQAKELTGPVATERAADFCDACANIDSLQDQGLMCSAVRYDGRLFGFAMVLLPAVLVNRSDEQELFGDVAVDLAFALHSLDLEQTRNRAVEAAMADRERLQVTLESVGDAVITTDSDGSITMLNSVAQQLTGWSADEAIGRPLPQVFSIINEISRKPCRSPVVGVLQADRTVNLADNAILIARDGTERLIADSGAPIRDRGGRVIGVVLVFRDVTEARQLRIIAGRAQRLETAGQIAGQIAHDFNNLLGPLVAYPGLLREEYDSSSEVQALLGDMEKSALRMSEINQQLLTLGRRGHYSQTPIDLNPIVQQVLKGIHLPSPNLEIDTDLCDDLMNIRGGQSQIQRVVSNLIANAREAMNNVGRLSVRTENFYVDQTTGQFGRVPAGEYVKLTVTDTGCGIPANDLPRIFDPFFTTKLSDRTRGAGLGLSVVHSVLEDHDGYLDVATEEGRGTSFYVYLPVCRDTTERPLPDELVGGDEDILVVDDDSVQREVSLRLLQRLGYNVRVVASGEAAIHALKDSPADLLVLDIVMPPGIDGAQTYERILDFNPGQKAVVVSGFAENERVRRALEIGAGQYVRKPLTLKSLAAAVRQELDRQ